MSFRPLPALFLNLLDQLKNLENAKILDLGSGAGTFRQLLKERDLPVLEMDRSRFSPGGDCFMRGDALWPPVLSGSLHCLLVGNLWRHMLVQEPSGDFISRWLDLLMTGGCLFIFEDQPTLDDPAGINYWDLQHFLTRLMPGQRGPLRSLDFFRQWSHQQVPVQNWQSGVEANLEQPNLEEVCHLLEGEPGMMNAGGDAARVLSSVKSSGLSYGAYWWACTKVED